MNMVCKFLFYVIYIVDSPTSAPYSVGAFVQAENEEHATICVQDYFLRHSLTASIIHVQYLPHFLIATSDQYPKSKLLSTNDGNLEEFDDLP